MECVADGATSLFHAGSGQSRWPDDIAHCVDVRLACAVVLVHLDLSARSLQNANLVQSESLHIGGTALRHQHFIAQNLFAGFQFGNDLGSSIPLYRLDLALADEPTAKPLKVVDEFARQFGVQKT